MNKYHERLKNFIIESRSKDIIFEYSGIGNKLIFEISSADPVEYFYICTDVLHSTIEGCYSLSGMRQECSVFCDIEDNGVNSVTIKTDILDDFSFKVFINESGEVNICPL